MENFTRYKGKGEHSVKELELIIAQREEELHVFKSQSESELIKICKEILEEFEDEKVLKNTPIAYFKKFNRLEELIKK